MVQASTILWELREKEARAIQIAVEEIVSKLSSGLMGENLEEYVATVISASSKLSKHGSDNSIAPLNTGILRLAQHGTAAGISNCLFLIDKSLTLLEEAPSDQSMRLLVNALPVLALSAKDVGVYDFERRRKDIADAWLNTQSRARADLLTSSSAQAGEIEFNMRTASAAYLHGFPEYEPDPVLREKIFEKAYRHRFLGRERIKLHYLRTQADKFEALGSSLIGTTYARSPYALDELQVLLDRRIGQEQGSNIMNAVFRSLPKAFAAAIPRPIPHASKASEPQVRVGTGDSGLPAIARPSKLRDRINAGSSQGVMGAVSPGASGKSAAAVEPASGGAGQPGGRPLWPWAVLGLVAAAGGWVWLRQRG